MKKVRFGLIALALTISIGGAFATKSNVKAHAGDPVVYGVLSQDATNYYVSLSNPDDGSCTSSLNVCKISTADVPDEEDMNAIPVGDATIITANATFQAGTK